MSVNLVRNPRALTDLWDGREIGDPFLMRFDGKFYLYCSSHGNAGVKCWVSCDMIHFEYYGLVATDPRIHGAYAPEVIYNAGKFWMVTSPRGSGHYLLRADTPVGPFEVITENLGNGIDGSQFVDDDGTSWFYRSSHQGIRVHKMPSPEEIDVRNQPIPASFLNYWTEGPQVIKRDGRYFLTDTGNHVCSKGYHIDYCVSHEGPDKGFRRLRDGMLLIETRDEFHALGHSSSCIGPDMDTYYIIYHKNILNERNWPLHRSLNIDRMYFNGDRLYTNATWWYQNAPKQPVCASRNGEGLAEAPFGLALDKAAGDIYTAEINFIMKGDSAKAHFSVKGDEGGAFEIQKDRKWILTINGDREEGILPENVATDAIITVKISKFKENLIVYVNGMKVIGVSTVLKGGLIGISGDVIPHFIGFSDVAQGSDEGEHEKSVPGSFDAVHGFENEKSLCEGETGCNALFVKKGESAKYKINVWKTRKYALVMTVGATDNEIGVTVNGISMTAAPTGVSTEDGLEKRYFGEIELTEGFGEMVITAENDVIIDRIYLIEKDDFAPAAVISKGEDASNGRLSVIGHKAAGSMHKKFCGYTAAEGYGEAWFGGNWHDFEVKMLINMKPCAPEARASAYIRTSRESWHQHQVAAGRFGYEMRITENKIELLRNDYKETKLLEAPIFVEWGSQIALTLRAEGNRISVTGDGIDLTFTDPMAHPIGRCGLSAHTDGIGFEEFSVCEI